MGDKEEIGVLYGKEFEDILGQLHVGLECEFCSYEAATTNDMEIHLNARHFNFAVNFYHNDQIAWTLPCKKDCVVRKSSNEVGRAHFHCPFCKHVYLRSQSFRSHVKHNAGYCAPELTPEKTLQEKKTKTEKKITDLSQNPITLEVGCGSSSSPQVVPSPKVALSGKVLLSPLTKRRKIFNKFQDSPIRPLQFLSKNVIHPAQNGESDKEFSNFGFLVASKLKKLRPEKSDEAMHHIMDYLYRLQYSK